MDRFVNFAVLFCGVLFFSCILVSENFFDKLSFTIILVLHVFQHFIYLFLGGSRLVLALRRPAHSLPQRTRRDVIGRVLRRWARRGRPVRVAMPYLLLDLPHALHDERLSGTTLHLRVADVRADGRGFLRNSVGTARKPSLVRAAVRVAGERNSTFVLKSETSFAASSNL